MKKYITAGKAKEYIEKQVTMGLSKVDKEKLTKEDSLIIAYEPVWAIGTGKVCSKEEANSICKVVREKANEILGIDIPVLYGGSVNEVNSDEILKEENIDGVLVGGASLDPEKFAKIAYSGHSIK